MAIVRYPCADGTEVAVYLSSENAGTSSATLAGWIVDDLNQTMARPDSSSLPRAQGVIGRLARRM